MTCERGWIDEGIEREGLAISCQLVVEIAQAAAQLPLSGRYEGLADAIALVAGYLENEGLLVPGGVL